MISTILIMIFSTLDTFASPSSEKSVIQNVNSALNFDNPQMCENFDDVDNCIGQFAYVQKNPRICTSYIEDKESQYDCISNFFRKYQEKACYFVDEEFKDRCINEVQNYYKK